MAVISSAIDPNSETFQANRRDMLALVDQFRALEARVRDTFNQKLPLFQKRGQLTPRQRIAHLIDRGSPFLEISTLAGLNMHDDDGAANIQGGGVIAGIGYVSGVRCVIGASDSGIKGGTTAPMGLRKNLRVQDIVMRNKLPYISLVESGGANLNYQAEIFVDGGRTFANMARMSALGIPHIAVVHGSSTAGGAYHPGLSDYVIVVKGRSKIFLAGPPLLKAATGEIASDEELGGADMHAMVSGVAEYLAEDDADALRIAREVIARLVDDSDFLDFKPLYGTDTVCGQAAIEGEAVGLIGNNGPIDADGAVKAAQFIQLCDQADMPLVFLQNTTGYMVGKQYEQAGMVKDGAKMINAVANSTVPHLTVIIGASYGAGNYGMCGRAYDPRFLFTWPNARIAVMGPQQLAGVLSIVARQGAESAGKAFDEEADAAQRAVVEEQIERESKALFMTGKLYDDGIIDPRDTRTVLGICLSSVHGNVVEGRRGFGVFRM
jgi:geranyl-CoA carboxylase beta subunit